MIRYDPQSLTYQNTFHLVLTVFQLDGGSTKLITFANYQIIKNVPDRWLHFKERRVSIRRFFSQTWNVPQSCFFLKQLNYDDFIKYHTNLN